jgi:hypothetical protein
MSLPRLRFARLGAAARRARSSMGKVTHRGALVVAILGVALSVVFFLATAAVSSLAAEYGFHPEANANAWRALAPVYGDVSLCATCHAPEFRKLTGATHVRIGCESCHGPLGTHALASPSAREAAAQVAVPTDGVCVTCHAAALGRPAGFRQIVPADHYGAACLQCHDPHTGISVRPPIVQHPLDHLPPCLTCHGPDGFKARSQRHPTVSDDDQVCLSCHLAGRGPADDPPGVQ